jgi:hypothetical protein
VWAQLTQWMFSSFFLPMVAGCAQTLRPTKLRHHFHCIVGQPDNRGGRSGTMVSSDIAAKQQEAQDQSEERERFIPVRKSDLLDALVDHGGLATREERDAFRRFWRQLASIYHYSCFDQLEKLRDDYYYFNPDIGASPHLDGDTLERLHGELDESLAEALREANFVELPHADIKHAHSRRHVLQVQIETPTDDYREIRFFHRAHHTENVEVTGWFGLTRRTVQVGVYDHVVVLVMIKGAEELSKAQLKRLAKNKLRPGSILIKYFRNVAAADLSMLFPEVRVVMSAFDKVVLGLPAIAGGIPIILNLLPTITVLFLVIGFYLGISGEVENDAIKKAFAALSGIAALGGFIFRQWLRYQRQSLKYQKEISDNIYFRNVNNNSGIFDYIIGQAEEQDTKEVFLAYYFLLTAPGPLTQPDLEGRIEGWLRERFQLDVTFAVDNALRMLGDLSLVKRDGEKLTVHPLDTAIVVLDRVWAKFFPAPSAAA